MLKQLKYMKGEEFVKKILAGERNFSDIELEENFNLNNFEWINDLQTYLKDQNFEKSPFLFNSSEFIGIKAACLQFPFSKGYETNFGGGATLYDIDFSYSDFMRANFFSGTLNRINFSHSNLSKADFGIVALQRAYFNQADLNSANFYGACLDMANLQGANLFGTQFSRATFTRADLRYTTNLEKSISLEFALFSETKVTEEEKKIIEEILSKPRTLFVVGD